MLKQTSVRSSEPQVRNPTGLKKQSPNSGFHKTMTNLLEPLPLPFPSYQIVKDSSHTILSKYQFYAWKRPQHLRPQWLIVSDLGAAIIDPRDNTRVFSIKFPFHQRRVQHSGPIVCEAAYDSQEATLWIWDVLIWEKEDQYTTKPYSQRWKLLQYIATSVFDADHPTSEISIRLPEWESLSEVSKTIPDKGYAVEFQPERSGQRRFLWIPPREADTFKPTTHHERKMIADKAFEKEVIPVVAPAPVVSIPVVSDVPPLPSAERHVVGYITRNPRSKLPEASPLTTLEGEDIGLPVIRRLDLSKQLRELLSTNERVKVTLQWCDSFQKYEIRQVVQTESS